MRFKDNTIVGSGFSDAFKTAALEEGFSTIPELLAIPVADLLRQDWFTTSMLEELHVWVKENDLRS